ncbi:MAG: hypothetical protein HYY78_03715 [Betaproteobacteria bacterium]|nr:hypothetical protein [Betaproteobacteria bacterium]
MALETLQSTSTLAASLAALAAVLSGVCAFLSYRLARKIQDDLKTDERIIAGTPIHPDLHEHAHSACVIQCTLFNKSKRKAYVNAVSAYDRRGSKVDVTWSHEIDQLGNPKNPCQLIGLVDACPLFIQKNDGESIEYARITISHSFPDTPMDVIFDPTADWVRE